MIKNETKSTEVVMAGLKKAIGHCARTVTFDNGKEFTNHTILNNDYQIPTYFCNPGAPYQKGSVENSNGMLRYYFPFKVFARTIKQRDLGAVASIINHIPRKILGYLTPCEVFSKDFKEKLYSVAFHH